MTRAIFPGILISVMVTGISSTALAKVTPEECKAKAIAAARAIETEGDAAIAKINALDGPFVWDDHEGFVWAFDLNGILVAHPKLPNYIGKNILRSSDSQGTPYIKNMIRLIESDGDGWVGYLSLRNLESQESIPIVAYITKAVWDNKTYIVASAVFEWTLEDIIKQFPDDAVYEE